MSAQETSRVRVEHLSADLVRANISVGIRLWAGATVFFFVCPFLAYLYLRTLNSVDQWRPAGIDPPQALGAATMVLAVASSAALFVGRSAVERTAYVRGLQFNALALGLGLASVVVQLVAYFRLGFGPMDGGYASVYIAWTALNALFAAATMLWLETLVAYSWRSRDTHDAATRDDPFSPVGLIEPRLAALAFYWPFLTAFGVVMWILLYLA